MKANSRPNPKPPSRPAPYKKRRASGHVTPAHGTRRAQDASQPRGLRPVSPRAQERRDEARPSRADPSAGDERSPLPTGKTGRTRVSPHTRMHTGTDGSARERPGPAHTDSLSAQANIPGPPLRLPLSSTPPTVTTFAVSDRKKTESPPPGSPVSAFLRSIQLPDKPASTPSLQRDFSSAPPSLRPPQSGDNAANGAYINGPGNSYQVSLAYKGHSFTYELSALPDDPKGTIALLTLTKSDPGPYFLVAAHYRRTGRSRAACAVIRSLLDNLGNPTDGEKGKDAAPIPTLDTSTVTLPCSGTSCPIPPDSSASVLKRAVMRPAMLLLAACELDISRDSPDGPESASHASTAHDLFRAVYGTVNDAIIAGAARSPSKNALGLDFSSNGNRSSTSSSESNGPLPSITLPPDPESLARINNLEKELDIARVAYKKLKERLYVSDNRLSRAEDKVHGLESHSREVRMRLDASRDENWELRKRLVDSERRARELAHCAPPSETRVWGKLKDLLFDNFGSGVHGE